MSAQLDLTKTYRAILDAARKKRFISYSDLAKANDAVWKKVQYEVYRQLDCLVKIAATRGWPMLTSIVVNKNNIETGTLDGRARDGFIGAAQRFGVDVGDPATFVEEQQQAVFVWAESAPDELESTSDELPDTRKPAKPEKKGGPEEEVEVAREEAEIAPYGIDDILGAGCFLAEEALESALSRLKAKKNLILQGPPGTGKTWLAKRLGYALVGTSDRAVIGKRMRSIQFHPSLSYEDFVRGWRPDENDRLSLVDGVFLKAVEAARAEPDRPFVVIIEEINRGNPAQIFGEMLTLLEKDKRSEEEAVELAYCRKPGERIFIPSNLFVIGTMNIADRSLALVDLALRRRFAFVALETALNERWRKWCIEQAGIDETVLAQIQGCMTELNAAITADRSLGAQFEIGHSYVTPARGEAIRDAKAWFHGIVETEIAPLLEEYWFDNLDQAATWKKRLLQCL